MPLLYAVVVSALLASTLPTTIGNPIESRPNPKKQKIEIRYFVGNFLEAGVWEGIFSYTFQDNRGKKMSFVQDVNHGDTIPLPLYMDEANKFANPLYAGKTFKIGYISLHQEIGESIDRIRIYKIRSLEMK
ncbi:hypothetical protein [Leptospira kobayashii]|uniref:hypothetical protein n=1 Tax=Leptospira kobayashii TaxID=1917830 RepID=UPI00107F690F|nr:hypothetical protein [Leptospira kobayashii]